jgi:hypothetical protein
MRKRQPTRHQVPLDKLNILIVAIAAALLATASCSLPGWNSNLQDFVNTGFTTAYLASSSYSRAAGEANADVRAGEPVTVTVRINNPKSIPLSYTLDVDPTLVTAAVAAPADTATATNGVTTVSFTFTPTEAAEHGDITFKLGLAAPTLNRTFDPAYVNVHCDSPPDPVNNLSAGHRKGGYADIGFTLPENYANEDIAAVRITYKNTATNVEKTVTEPVGRKAAGLTDVPVPALLNSNAGLYVRYFLPADVVPDNPYTFTVVTLDASGKASEKPTTPASVSVKGTERYLGYDANGGTGSVAATFDFYGQTTTVAPSASLSYAHHLFMSWNTQADGKGTGYIPGETFTFPNEDTMLYAQWLPLGNIGVTLTEPTYGKLSFTETGVKLSRGTFIILAPSATPDSVTAWQWYIDETPQPGANAKSYSFDSTGRNLGDYAVTCAAVAGGVIYSGTVRVTVIDQLKLSYDGNGNTSGAAPAPQSFNLRDTVTLTAVAADFAKAGYAFAGWATSAERAASGIVDYADGATTGSLGDYVTLYAVWSNLTPSPVGSLSAAPGDMKVTLTWTDPAGADLAYIVVSYTGLATDIKVGPGAQRCVIKDLVNGSAYTFTVRAVNKAGASSPTASVSATPNP